MDGLDWRSLSTLDLAALGLLGVAMVRGLWIGVIREAFSLAAIAAACLAVRLGGAPAAGWLLSHGPADLSLLAARVAAALGVAAAAFLAVHATGRVLRRSAHAVGLGFADRIGGGLLGAAEGALLLALCFLVGFSVLGRNHPALASSRAVQVFEDARHWAGSSPGETPDVAAPPPGSSRAP